MTNEIVAPNVEKLVLWVDEISEELNWNEPKMSYHAMRTVLHLLRDRLPVPEGAQLASQLPMIVRGCFYENWKPKVCPARIRLEEFLDKIAFAFPGDLTVNPESIARAVFAVIARHVSVGEIADVRANLPTEFETLWP